MAAKRKRAKSPGRTLSPQEKTRFDDWLAGIEADREAALITLSAEAEADPALAVAFVEGLAASPTEAAGWLAVKAAETIPLKSVRKAAKRAAYLLKNKGVRLPETGRPRPIFKPGGPVPARGYLGGYLADGNQLVFLAVPGPGGRIVGGAAVINYRLGFQELSLAPMSGGRFKELLAQAIPELSLPPVEVGQEDLAWVLKGAVEATRSQGRALPSEATFLAEWLTSLSTPLDIAPIYARLGVDPGAGPEPDRLRRLSSLLEEAPLAAWLIDYEDWVRVRDEVEARSSSSLVLSRAQEAAKLDEAFESVVDDLFPPSARPAWRRRLEETAVFLEGSGRVEDALVLLAGAAGLERRDNPLFRVLIERAWQAEAAMAAYRDGLRTEQAGSEELQPDQEPPRPGSGRLIVGEGDQETAAEPAAGLILPPGVKE